MSDNKTYLDVKHALAEIVQLAKEIREVDDGFTTITHDAKHLENLATLTLSELDTWTCFASMTEEDIEDHLDFARYQLPKDGTEREEILDFIAYEIEERGMASFEQIQIAIMCALQKLEDK